MFDELMKQAHKDEAAGAASALSPPPLPPCVNSQSIFPHWLPVSFFFLLESSSCGLSQIYPALA